MISEPWLVVFPIGLAVLVFFYLLKPNRSNMAFITQSPASSEHSPLLDQAPPPRPRPIIVWLLYMLAGLSMLGGLALSIKTSSYTWLLRGLGSMLGCWVLAAGLDLLAELVEQGRKRR